MRAPILTAIVAAAALLASGGTVTAGRPPGGSPPQPRPGTPAAGAPGMRHGGYVPAAPGPADEALATSGMAYRRAQTLLRSGDLAGAEAECRRSIALAPTIDTPKVKRVSLAPNAAHMLGEICLRRGRNAEALRWFLGLLPFTVGQGVNVDVVIAYCRLGDYRRARSFYPTAGLLERSNGWSPRDLPGTDDLRSLEASALLTRGMDVGAEGRDEEALDDYLAAERLVPRSPLAAYFVARGFSGIYSRLNTPEVVRVGTRTFARSELTAQALPRWERAASLAHEPIRSRARQMVESSRRALRRAATPAARMPPGG